MVADNPTLANNDPKYSTIINAIFVCFAIHSALMYSGGVYNPMLATVLLGGCKGHDWTDHFLIYWIGSTAGALFGAFLYPLIHAKMYAITEETTKKIQ